MPPPPPKKEQEESSEGEESESEEVRETDPPGDPARRPPEPASPPARADHSRDKSRRERRRSRDSRRREGDKDRSSKKKRRGVRGGRNHSRLYRLVDNPEIRVHRRLPPSYLDQVPTLETSTLKVASRDDGRLVSLSYRYRPEGPVSWENFMPHRDQAIEIPLQTTDYGTDEDISASFSLPSVVFRGEELRVRRSGNHQRLVISVQQKRRGALIFAQVGHAGGNVTSPRQLCMEWRIFTGRTLQQ